MIDNAGTIIGTFALGTLMPLIGLLAGTGSIAPEIDDGSIIYVLAKPIRRGTIIISCASAKVLDTIIAADPRLGTLSQLTGLPQSSQICPSSTQAGGSGGNVPGSGGGGG